jgi:hypothetical protein
MSLIIPMKTLKDSLKDSSNEFKREWAGTLQLLNNTLDTSYECWNSDVF